MAFQWELYRIVPVNKKRAGAQLRRSRPFFGTEFYNSSALFWAFFDNLSKSEGIKWHKRA